MKKLMKQNIIYSLGVALIVTCIAVLSVSTGCKTVPPVFNLTTAANNLQLSTDIDAYYAMQKNPETRQIFVAVTARLDLLVASKAPSSAQLEAAILPLIGTNADARLAVMAGIGLYEANFDDAVSAGLDDTAAKVLLTALNAGFKQALTQPAGQKTYRGVRR